MRNRYLLAVLGCLAHAAVLTIDSYLWARSASKGESGGSWFFITFLYWPLWGVLLWKLARPKKKLVVIPMTLGVIILAPVWLGFLAVLGAPVPQ